MWLCSAASLAPRKRLDTHTSPIASTHITAGESHTHHTHKHHTHNTRTHITCTHITAGESHTYTSHARTSHAQTSHAQHTHTHITRTHITEGESQQIPAERSVEISSSVGALSCYVKGVTHCTRAEQDLYTEALCVCINVCVIVCSSV